MVMKLLFISCIAILVCSCFSASAQNSDRVFTGNPSEQYIQKLDTAVVAKLSFTNNVKSFLIIDKGVPRYTIIPNNRNLLVLSGNYHWLSVMLFVAPRFLPGNNDDNRKGHSQSLRFSINTSFKQWSQDLTYAHVKGYYLGNTGDFNPGWRPGIDPYILFPNLVYSEISGQTGYRFNKNFSYNALRSQTE